MKYCFYFNSNSKRCEELAYCWPAPACKWFYSNSHIYFLLFLFILRCLVNCIHLKCILNHILSSSLISEFEGQTCQKHAPSSQCSTNPECGCLSMAISNHGDICAYLLDACSNLQPCQSNNRTFSEHGHICVTYSQGGNRPLCYSMKLSSQYLCPPKKSDTT